MHLLLHLERKEFKFTYSRLVDEIRGMKQAEEEIPLEFAHRFA